MIAARDGAAKIAARTRKPEDDLGPSPAGAPMQMRGDAARRRARIGSRSSPVPAREQPLRPHDQRHHHHGVDDEGADRGDVIFAGDVEHAEQQRAEQGPQDAVRAADVTTMRKVTRNFTGNAGSMPPTTSAASAPPRPASPLPTAKVMAKMRSTLMPRPWATRGSSTAALSCAPNRVPTRNDLQAAAMIPQTRMMNSR